MSTSVFDTTTNLWSDAFLAGREGDLDDDDDNDDSKNDHNDYGTRTTTRITTTSFSDTKTLLW